MTVILKPPNLRELAQDPIYRQYLRTSPKLPEALQWGCPWRLWVEVDRSNSAQEQSKWLTKKYATYQEAWNKAVKAMRSPTTLDVCIVSLRYFFEPPIAETKRMRSRTTQQIRVRDIYWLPDPPYEWCFRCRRPSLFVFLPSDHHALRTQPVVDPESPFRCYYCGMRRAGQPSAKHYNFHGVGSE